MVLNLDKIEQYINTIKKIKNWGIKKIYNKNPDYMVHYDCSYGRRHECVVRHF